MKKLVMILGVAMLSLSLVACGGSSAPAETTAAAAEASAVAQEGAMTYKDGEYKGVFVKEGEYKSTGEVVIKVAGGKIVEASYVEKDGKDIVKDAEYGKAFGEEKYKAAQVAVAAAQTYPVQLIATQDLSKVDAISGATSSHAIFVEAAKAALEQAK